MKRLGHCRGISLLISKLNRLDCKLYLKSYVYNMSESILAADRGLVLTLQSQVARNGNSDIDEPHTSDLKNKLRSYSYSSKLAKFVLCTECDTNITKNEIITCTILEDFASGTVHPCLLIENTNTGKDDHPIKKLKSTLSNTFQYQVFFSVSDQLKLINIGSFSCEASLSNCKTWSLDGPTFCWEHQGHLNVAKLNIDKPRHFQVEQIPSNVWTSESDHNLHWCKATTNNLVVIATTVNKEPVKSDGWLDDLGSKKKWSVLLFERQNLEKTETKESPLMPNLYSNIVNCLYMTPKSARKLRSKDGKDSLVTILATTRMGQLLMFGGGKVQRLCDLPFKDTCRIVVVSRPSAGDLVVVMSRSGMVCVVDWKSFKIIKQWDGVSNVYIDDFLFNGSDQMLIVHADPSTHPLQSFILTDLDACYINDRDNEGCDKLPGDLACNDSLASAVTALETRLQSGLASLRDVENKCCERNQLIEQSHQALNDMVMGKTNKADGNDQKQLSCLYDGSLQPGIDPEESTTLADQTEGHPVHILEVWQRVVQSQWVVGVTAKNTSDRKMENVCLGLVPTNTTGHWLEPMTSQCTGVQLPCYSDDDKELNSKLTKPKKRIKGTDIPQLKRLSPAEKADIVATSALPVFISSVISCDLVLAWKEWQGVSDADGQWVDRVGSFGRVTVTSADVVSGQLGVVLDAKNTRSGKELDHDIAALNASQISTCLCVTTLHSYLGSILEVLTTKLKFHPWCAMHDGLVCTTDGVLWGVRARLVIEDSCQGQLTVWTRDKNQLMLLIQALYHHLPDDVIIYASSPSNDHIEGAITNSIQSMKQELATLVIGISDLQSAPSSACDDDDVVVMETDSDIDDAARKIADIRKKFETEQLELKDSGMVAVSKQNLRRIRIDSIEKKEQTDLDVRTLSRNMMLMS